MSHCIPLNPIQYKFWMDDLLKYPTSEYNDTNYVFVVEGNLSVPTLKEAYRLLSLEYLPLCSTIQIKDGNPYFVSNIELLKVNDIYVTSVEEVNDIIMRLAEQPFDLKKEAPSRFYIIHLDNRFFLFHLFHHVVMDGLSLRTFFNRLSTIYNQLLDGNYIAIDQMKMLDEYNQLFEVQYHKNRLQNVGYWRNYMKGVPLRLPVPHTPLECSSIQQKEYAYTFDLGAERNFKIQSFCRSQKTTCFRLFSSVWAFTLSRILRVDNLLLDHTLNMRSKEYDSLFGVFVNNLPVKYLFQAEKTFADILIDVNESRVNERIHSAVFYSDILQYLYENGDIDKRESINIGINYPIEYRALTLYLTGCNVNPYKHVNVNLSADLVLAIEENDIFTCEIRYRSTISLNFIRVLSQVFCEILDQVILFPHIKLKNIRLISFDLQKKILEKENRALGLAEPPQTFFKHFKRTVLDNALRDAVFFSGKKISYAQLDEFSDRVASVLLKMGFSHQCIGLFMPKNIEMIIGILGIMKSGNIYVPIDYDYPNERINFIINDSKIALILLSQEAIVPFGGMVQSLLVEDMMCQVKERGLVLPTVSPSDIAYIIYTSGTTGNPKGIPIKHSALYQTIINNIDILQLNTCSRVLQFASISFDASILEIFPTLVVGALLVLPQEKERKDSVLLLDLLDSQRITSCSIPPVLLAALPHVELPFLSTIIIGGDSTSSEAIKYWSQGRRFINSYGPAENAVDATYSVMQPNSSVNDIGCNVSGTTCYILDQYLHLVPDYTIGELYIGGVKLTEGYLNRFTLNKEKFIQNPFVSGKSCKMGYNQRLYKSGDLVMRRKDGHLIFIGRSDFQVKLNGYRIELEEIESRIMEFGSIVKDAVAILHECGERKQLVAYVQVESAVDFPVGSLKSFLREYLPEYMIPVNIVPLKSFPYSANGKVDRKKLSVLKMPQVTKEYKAPSTMTEKQIAKIWGQLLNVHFIDCNDSFLSLGGDSIGIIQLTSRIHESFGLIIRASDIYKYNTVSQLSAFIDTHRDYNDSSFEKKLINIAQRILNINQLDANIDLFSLGMSDLQVKDFVNYAATEANLFFTTTDVQKTGNIKSLLKQIDPDLYFWTEGHYTGKPVIVFLGGFVEYYPYNEGIATFLEKDFSVFFVESYYKFFLQKDKISLDALFQAYEDIFLVALRDKPIFMITGYCSGAEIAIAFAQYMLRKHPDMSPYRVLNMEAIYNRTLYNELTQTINHQSLKKRIDIFSELYRFLPNLDYQGPIINVMAGEPANLIAPEDGEITDPILLEKYWRAWQNNLDAWQEHYPQAPFYKMACNHMNFPEEKNLVKLREIISKHWGI